MGEGMPVLKFPETPDNRNKNEKADYFDEELKLAGVIIHEEGETRERYIDCKPFKAVIPEDKLKYLERAVLGTTQFLATPLLTDSITDPVPGLTPKQQPGHQQRRDWRHTMEKAYGARARFLVENRMRNNKIMGVESTATRLKNALREAPQDSEVVQELTRLADALLTPLGDIKEFKELPSTTKDGSRSRFTVVKEMSVAAREFLDYLENPRGLELKQAA